MSSIILTWSSFRKLFQYFCTYFRERIVLQLQVKINMSNHPSIKKQKTLVEIALELEF